MLQTRSVEKERFCQSKALKCVAFGFGGIPGEEAFVLEAIMNNLNPFTRHFKKSANVCGRVFADGYDFILPPRQLFRDDTAINHPFPIIFLRDTKWREVVNG